MCKQGFIISERSMVKHQWQMGMGRACDPDTLNLGWLKRKRFGMAVEKSGLVFSVWRSWRAHLVVRRESPGPQGYPKGHNYLLGQTRSWLLGLIRNKSPQTGAE